MKPKAGPLGKLLSAIFDNVDALQNADKSGAQKKEIVKEAAHEAAAQLDIPGIPEFLERRIFEPVVDNILEAFHAWQKQKPVPTIAGRGMRMVFFEIFDTASTLIGINIPGHQKKQIVIRVAQNLARAIDWPGIPEFAESRFIDPLVDDALEAFLSWLLDHAIVTHT